MSWTTSQVEIFYHRAGERVMVKRLTSAPARRYDVAVCGKGDVLAAFVFIGIGGFLGANARYLLTIAVNQFVANRFGSALTVWGTLFVNVTGSLLLALFVSWAARHVTISEHWRLLIGTGFFGAYTTFSTYAVESIALARDVSWLSALGNIIGTNLLCLIGVLIGLALAQRLWT